MINDLDAGGAKLRKFVDDVTVTSDSIMGGLPLPRRRVIGILQ
jgi:hypothetical protein